MVLTRWTLLAKGLLVVKDSLYLTLFGEEGCLRRKYNNVPDLKDSYGIIVAMTYNVACYEKQICLSFLD